MTLCSTGVRICFLSLISTAYRWCLRDCVIQAHPAERVSNQFLRSRRLLLMEGSRSIWMVGTGSFVEKVREFHLVRQRPSQMFPSLLAGSWVCFGNLWASVLTTSRLFRTLPTFHRHVRAKGLTSLLDCVLWGESEGFWSLCGNPCFCPGYE